jgi:hypothetical protein
MEVIRRQQMIKKHKKPFFFWRGWAVGSISVSSEMDFKLPTGSDMASISIPLTSGTDIQEYIYMV